MLTEKVARKLVNLCFWQLVKLGYPSEPFGILESGGKVGAFDKNRKERQILPTHLILKRGRGKGKFCK